MHEIHLQAPLLPTHPLQPETTLLGPTRGMAHLGVGYVRGEYRQQVWSVVILSPSYIAPSYPPTHNHHWQ